MKQDQIEPQAQPLAIRGHSIQGDECIPSIGRERPPTLVQIYRIEGPLSFVAKDLDGRANKLSEWGLEALVIRLDRLGYISEEGLIILKELMQRMQIHGIRVILCGAAAQVHDRLLNAGLTRFSGQISYHDCIAGALFQSRHPD